MVGVLKYDDARGTFSFFFFSFESKEEASNTDNSIISNRVIIYNAYKIFHNILPDYPVRF